MGNFYVNYTVKCPNPKTVAKVLEGRTAVVTKEKNGCVVVYDEESDEQVAEVIEELGQQISSDLNCAVLAVLNHDDDILAYQLFEGGELVDEYDSSPGYFGDGEDEEEERETEPVGGDSHKLCETFGAEVPDKVEAILRKSQVERDGYTFAIQRHTDLVKALKIPEFAIGISYESISHGEYPDGIDEGDLIQIG